MDPAFSRPGEQPTAFEEQLVAAVQVEQPRGAKQLWLMLAQRVGLEHLMAGLDEFGDDHVWVPTRSGLMQELWAQVRTEEIRRLTASTGLSFRAIARQLNVSHTTVQRAARVRHGKVPVGHGKKRR